MQNEKFLSGLDQPPVDWEIIDYIITHDVRIVGYIKGDKK